MKCRDGISRIFAHCSSNIQHHLPPWESVQVTRQTIKKLIAEIGELKNEVPLFFRFWKSPCFDFWVPDLILWIGWISISFGMFGM